MNVAGKAVIVNPDGKVLILRESPTHKTNTMAGHYQLPGGRLEPGETFEQGLRREVREEAGLEITIGKPLQLGEWRPVIQGVPHQVFVVFVAAETNSRAVTVSDEHDDYLWIDPIKRRNYDIMPQDDTAIDAYVQSKLDLKQPNG